MKCFVDLDGEIPAKIGDRVARAECDDVVFIQKDPDMRPIYVWLNGVGGITDTECYGITGNNGEYLEGEVK